jgi:3-deoxy-D-manno-octulosonate 8-phosphate phosphatase (KDO 8-P phosphatase)
MGSAVKLPIFQEWMKKYGFAREQVAFVGDDIPDLHVLAAAGLSIAPADAAAEIKDVVKYISPRNGGYGVARDLLEQVMKAQGLWLDDKHAFGW